VAVVAADRQSAAQLKAQPPMAEETAELRQLARLEPSILAEVAEGLEQVLLPEAQADQALWYCFIRPQAAIRQSAQG